MLPLISLSNQVHICYNFMIPVSALQYPKFIPANLASKKLIIPLLLLLFVCGL